MSVSTQQIDDSRTPPPGGRSAGRVKRQTTTLRRCIASGALRPKAELIRFVAGPDGTVVPDLAERLPGRGLWLSPQREEFDRACKRNLFAKAAKARGERLSPADSFAAAQAEKALGRTNGPE